MTLGVLDLNRPKLGVFLFLSPTQTAVGEADNANDDQNDADYSSWFHGANATAAGDR